MTGQYAFSPENGRQGRIFFLVLALHAVVLYCVAQHKLRQGGGSRRDTEIHIDLIWPKIVQRESAKPDNTAPPAKTARGRAAPKAAPLPAAPRGDLPPTVAETPAQPAPAKPLDLQQVLKDVGPMIRKLDSEQPKGQSLQAEPGQPSFESKLGQVVANAAAKPKFYEPPRIEEISSSAQLDAGIKIYKITTFAGSYCVTYHESDPPVKGLCPIRF